MSIQWQQEFVGRLALFRDSLGLRPIYPDKLIRLRIDPNIALPEFIQLAADTDLVRQQIEAVSATTVGNWGISAADLKEIVFPIPPLEEQLRLFNIVKTLMRVCDRLAEQRVTVARARRALLGALLVDALQSGDTVAQPR